MRMRTWFQNDNLIIFSIIGYPPQGYPQQPGFAPQGYPQQPGFAPGKRLKYHLKII